MRGRALRSTHSDSRKPGALESAVVVDAPVLVLVPKLYASGSSVESIGRLDLSGNTLFSVSFDRRAPFSDFSYTSAAGRKDFAYAIAAGRESERRTVLA